MQAQVGGKHASICLGRLSPGSTYHLHAATYVNHKYWNCRTFKTFREAFHEAPFHLMGMYVETVDFKRIQLNWPPRKLDDLPRHRLAISSPFAKMKPFG